MYTLLNASVKKVNSAIYTITSDTESKQLKGYVKKECY